MYAISKEARKQEKKKKQKKPDVSLRKTFLVLANGEILFQKILFAGLNFKGEEMLGEIK